MMSRFTLRHFVTLVIGMVVIVAVTGLYVAGSPGTERERRFDDQRESDLREIASVIDLYYSRKGELPADLGLLAAESHSDYMVRSATDPVTGEPYRYEIVDPNEFRLCATFDQPSLHEDYREPRPYPVGEKPYVRDWQHGAGEHCFMLEAADTRFRTLCSQRIPCPTGESCAVLPGEDESYCVPEGKECIAAGCPGECTVLESYPLQVQCPMGDVPDASCVLMQETATGTVDCYGCADGFCKDPAAGWVLYDAPEVGIPYACFNAGNGCELAQ